jgi:hypothetical protein
MSATLHIRDLDLLVASLARCDPASVQSCHASSCHLLSTSRASLLVLDHVTCGRRSICDEGYCITVNVVVD